jgi:hypothetical protein
MAEREDPGPGREAERRVWEAVTLAVALLTARRTGSGVSMADILGDYPREPVIAVLVVLACSFLRDLLAEGAPGPAGEESAMTWLQGLGLAALEESLPPVR